MCDTEQYDNTRGLMMHRVGQSQLIEKLQKLSSKPRIQTGNDNKKTDKNKMTRTKEVRRSEGERETLCSWLNVMALKPNNKGVRVKELCLEEMLSFKVPITMRQCKSNHRTMFWGLIMVHQNSLNRNPVLLMGELNDAILRIVLSTLMKT